MKNILKKFLIGTLVAVAFVITANLALAFYDFGPTTLKVGSTGQYVTTLQNLVGATPVDGVFGPKTKANVVAWQNAHGLIADGLFGPASKAKANETGTNFSAGCTNASGFSTTTGFACTSINANTFSVGCTNASGFSTTTGFACTSINANTFPTGCTNASGFSTTTGFSCLTGIPATTIPIVRGGGSSGGHHTTALSDDATLSSTSTIKGFTPLNVGNLGTPNATLASAVAGSVIISTIQAADTTNLTSYITLFIPTNTLATTTKVVKYANGASTTGFADDTAYANQAITSRDFFIVKVTAQDSTILYYKIIVGIANDASLLSVADQSITAGAQVGTAESPKIDTITVPNDISVLARLDIQPVAFAHSFNLYSNNGFSTEITGSNTMALAVGDTHAYIKVTAYDNSTALYYDVTITRLPSSDATLKAASTIKGETIDLLGTPNAVLASAVAGSVIISTTQAAYTTNNLTPYITLFDKTNAAATLTRVVKYAAGAVTTGFASDSAYANEAITDQDFFIVKLTAQDGTTVLYYKIVVTVLVPTANVTFALTTPATDTDNTIAVVQTAGAKTIDVDVVNAINSVVITTTKTAGQTITKTGLAVVADVVGQPNSTYTVDTSTIAEEGGVETFTLTVSETNKTDIVYTVTVTVAAPGPVEITAFDAISNVAGGTTEVPTYANAAAVIADLNVSKATVTANTSAVTVPVTTWVDTDTYNSAAAGSYTFTATLGAIPEGFLNTGNYTATVEVVVGAPLTPATSNAYITVPANHIVTITLTGGGTFKTGAINTQDFTFTGTGNDWNVIAAATTFTRTSDTVVTITGIDGLLGAEDNIVAVLGEAQAIQATGVTAVATTPIDKTSESFTTVTGNNNVTVTLTGGTFKTDPIDATDFIFTGDNEAALEGATTFTRTSPTIVTITGLTLVDGTDTVTVLGEAQATQATSVAGVASLLLTNVTSGQYITVTGNNDILITLTGGGTFRANGVDPIDQQDFIFAGDEDHMVIDQATSFTRASNTEVIIAGIGTLAGYTTNTITVMGATMATQATGVTVVASTVNVYALRAIGPAGGWIFYRNGTSNDYLESAPNDESINTAINWSDVVSGVSGATGTAVGTGQANTTLIVAQSTTTSAADLCNNLEAGASNWFLPSQDELDLMYTNLWETNSVGNFGTKNYWSSSEVNADNARNQAFDIANPAQGTQGKGTTGGYARCVRAFHANQSIIAPITATFAHDATGDPIITVTALTDGNGTDRLAEFKGQDDITPLYTYTLTDGHNAVPYVTVTKLDTTTGNLTIATPTQAGDADAYTLTIIRTAGGQWAIAVTVNDLQTVDPANGSTVSATTPASPTHAVNFTYTVTVKDNTTAHAFVSGLTDANFYEAPLVPGTQTPASGSLTEVSVVEETSGVYTITAKYDTAETIDIKTRVSSVDITAKVTNVVVQ